MDDPVDLFRRWLTALGHEGDPEMDATATRFTELMREFLPQPDGPIVGSIALVSRDGLGEHLGAARPRRQLPVAIRDMPFHSLCAHHLVPFFGHATVCYIPRDKLAGFGSIARVVQHFARRPQLQERMAEQIADAIVAALDPEALIIRLVARQLCMEMRGARTPGDVEVLATRGTPSDTLFSMARG